MRCRTLTLSRFAAAGLALAVVAGAGEPGAARSPFLPAATSGPAAPTEGAPLQFHGYISTSEGVQYRIFDPASKKGEWVKLNETNSNLGVVLKQFDGEQDTITVEHQGRTLTLAARKAKIVSAGAVPQILPAPTNVARQMPASVTRAVIVNPTTADENRRLEAVAAEVARRRTLREQAAKQVGQGVAPQAVMPVAQPQQGQPQRNFQQNASGQGQRQQQSGRGQRGRGQSGRQQR